MRSVFMALEDPRYPDSGSRIRDFNFVKFLSAHSDLRLFSFMAAERSNIHFHELPITAFLDRRRPLSASVAMALLKQRALQEVRFDFETHGQRLYASLERADVIVASMLYPLLFLMRRMDHVGNSPRVVWDTHNYDPEVWRTRRWSGSLGHRIYCRLQQRRVDRVMDDAVAFADATIACSVADADRLRLHDASANVILAPNGVDLASWERVRDSEPDQNTVVLFGSLAQESTAVGATQFIRTTWPMVRRRRPRARLIVAGRKPSDQLASTACAAEGVQLVPSPHDIRPTVARASLIVIPQEWGTGSKLKVLEALASGRPIVATPPAVVGLPADLAKHVIVARHGEELAEEVLNVLAGGGHRHGGRLIPELQQYDWDRCFEAFGQWLFEPAAAAIGD